MLDRIQSHASRSTSFHNPNVQSMLNFSSAQSILRFFAGYVVGAVTDYINFTTCLVVFGVFSGVLICSSFYNQLDVALTYVQFPRQRLSNHIEEEDSVELMRQRRLQNFDSQPSSSILPV